MKPELQRIRIAEACGFTHIEILPGVKYRKTQIMGHSAEEERRMNIPDYLNDLNAMHEAEKVLTDDQWTVYTSWILDNTATYISKAGSPLRLVSSVHATAAQRAEAFLRTLNLWEDAK